MERKHRPLPDVDALLLTSAQSQQGMAHASLRAFPAESSHAVEPTKGWAGQSAPQAAAPRGESVDRRDQDRRDPNVDSELKRAFERLTRLDASLASAFNRRAGDDRRAVELV